MCGSVDETGADRGVRFGYSSLRALSGVFWYLASRQQVRRISATEVLDARDINRLIVAFNRTQLLNRRAAIATSAVGILAAIRLGLDIV